LLLGGDLDAAVVAYVARPDKRFRYYRLYGERIVTVVPKGHPFEQFEVVRLRDLQDENILFRTNCDMGDFLLESCRKQGFEPRVVYRSAREDWVQTMVASGFGIAVMPEFTHTDLATIARPIVDPVLVRQLMLVTVAGRRHEHAAASFLRAIRAHYRQEENVASSPERRSLMSMTKIIRSAPEPDTVETRR
jgi:DNA-binding transcriptional LysR family regulator